MIHAETPGVIVKTWGTEELIVNNQMDKYGGKRLTVMPDQACSIHYHKVKCETFFVITGRLVLEIYEPLAVGENPTVEDAKLKGRKILAPGKALTISRNVPHRFWAFHEPVQFLEFSTVDDPKDSFRITKSGLAPVLSPRGEW